MVENFLASRGQTNKVGKQEILHYNKKAVARVFHLEPSGYVVATLNRNEVPIKAHSFKGDFNKLPEEYKEFLSARLYEYSEMIEEAEKVQVVDSDYKKVWSYLENYTESSPKPMIETNILSIDGDGVVPALPKNTRAYTPNHENETLVNTAWGQGVTTGGNTDSTYNRFTYPVNVANDRSHVGCAPLAWGQIMRHHEWPLAPRGLTTGYRNDTLNVWISAENLENTTRYGSSTTPNNEYLWELMLDSVNANQNAQKEAIGILLADIGYALHAQWSTDGTSAWVDGPNDALNEIEEHFGYSQNMRREVYLTEGATFPLNEIVNYNTFINSIKTDIDNNQPLLFTYQGHATVIDGYIETTASGVNVIETHINFGWEGDDDNFYLFTASPVINNPKHTVGTLTKAIIVAGIRPCTSSANDCHPNFTGKEGITLEGGWNLVTIIGGSDDINYRDFTNADTSDLINNPPVWRFNVSTGQWNSNPINIKSKDVLWVKHVGTTEYVFPGSQRTSENLNSIDFGRVPTNGGNWFLGTGKDIPLSFLTLNGMNYCKLYDADPNNPQWVDCPSSEPIPAGSGILVHR